MAPNPGDENLVFACELDEPELQTRGADWTTLAAHVRSKVRTDKGFRIVYEPMAADALRSLVEAERLCGGE